MLGSKFYHVSKRGSRGGVFLLTQVMLRKNLLQKQHSTSDHNVLSNHHDLENKHSKPLQFVLSYPHGDMLDDMFYTWLCKYTEWSLC